MKTITNLSLILQQLCNQSNAAAIRGKGSWLVILTVLFITLLPFSKVMADTDFTQGKAVFTLNKAYGYIEAKIMGQDFDGTDDELDDIILYYLDPKTNTWIKFFHGDMDNDNAWESLTGTDDNLVKSMSSATIGDYKYGYFRFYYPRNLFQSSVLIKAEVDWDIDSNQSNTGADYTFYYNIHELDDVAWENYWSTIYNGNKNSLAFNFQICEIYGKDNINVLQADQTRNELDDLFIEYQDPISAKWTTIFNGDCDININDINLRKVSQTSEGTVSISTKLSSDRKNFYIATVEWNKLPERFVGKTVKFRYRADWDLRANENNLGIDITKEFYVTFSALKCPLAYPQGCYYSYEKQNVRIDWQTENQSEADITYHISRSLVGGTPEFITPVDGVKSPVFIDSLMANWKNYVYKIYAIPTSWGWTINDKLDKYSASYEISTNPKVPTFEKFTLTAFPTMGTKSPYVKVDFDKSEWLNVNTVNIYRRASTATVYTLLETLAPGSESYIDNNVTDNSKLFYKIEVDVFGHKYQKTDSVKVEKKVAFKSITASKNTIGDRIQLSWEIDRLDLCDRFEIYRSYTRDSAGIDIRTTPEMINQISAETVYNTWDDMTAVAGVVYEYKIRALRIGIDNELQITTSNSDIGFRMPVGTISGRITYGGGTAVDGVSVYVENSSLDDNMLYKSLMFKGEDSQKSQVNLTKNQHGCIKNGFSYQAWITSSRSLLYTPVFEVENEYSIGVRNDSVLVFIGKFNILAPSVNCKLDSLVKLNRYFHLSVTLDKNDTVKLFINGRLKSKSKLANSVSSYICTFSETDIIGGTDNTPKTKCYIGNKTNESLTSVKAYTGNIDDMRLWNKAISESEILTNYNRYLSGSEIGLIGYWPFDEGINSYAFDCSKTNQKFNEHHVKLVNCYTSQNVPVKEQLAIKGVTDKDGNYIIRGIPFTGTGSTYSLKPILGTHKFEPSQLVRYISPSSLVHNGSDFSDVSSFPIKVKVTYENTLYPVEGVTFYVDENPCVYESKLIATNKDGIAMLDVPIGDHYFKAQLNGHEFAYGGRYPNLGKVNINEAFAEGTQAKGISFIDTTKVIIAGRVSGGLIQNAIPVGFGRKVTKNTKLSYKSITNIGQATIKFTPNSILKSLNSSDTTRTLFVDNTRFKGEATALPGAYSIKVKTDPYTGEYMVKLPPLQWNIDSVSFVSKDKSVINILQDGSLTIKTNPLTKSFDTLTIENIKDTFNYNVKQNFVYRVAPTIEVSDVSPTAHGTFGEKYYYVQDPLTLKNDTISFYKDNTFEYMFENKPVFIQGRRYTFLIKAYERYFNSSNDSSDVALAGASVVVKNQMGKIVKTITPSVANDSVPTHEMTLSKEGKIRYEFLTGFPNLTAIKDGLGIDITLSLENKSYEWSQNGEFRGLVLGSEPISGSNFVTEGPLVPLVVLRDPPGSDSYAYMETGTTLSYSLSTKDNFNQSTSGSATVKAGADVEVGIGGLGVIVINDADWTADAHIGAESEYASFTGKSDQKTLTLTERIQTSSSPDFVGSNADVYIGTSTNILITECNVLDIFKDSNGKYILNKTIAKRGNVKAKTEFRFSQNEILTAQIPMWRDKFEGYFKTSLKKDAFDLIKKQASIYPDKNQYITYLDPENPDYGMIDSTYAVLRPVGKPNLANEVDSIARQIRNWRDVINTNESTKYSAKTNKGLYDVTNISFDAGASVERSYTYSQTHTDADGNTNNTSGIVGANVGFQAGGVGFAFSSELKIGGGKENNSESTTEKTTSFGYVLGDSDPDNRFSVNVYRNRFLSTELKKLKTDTLSAEYADKTLGSYIFEVVAGQSSCPYERVDSSLFYTKDNKFVKLAEGTQAIEVPYINIKNYSKSDVPTGKDATYILELGNNSKVQTSRGYILSVDDNSNPNGAIISVDGTPLTEGRLFYVAPGEILTKTLTLKQTKLDVLDYNNIKLRFSSPCDESISKEQVISAHYVPSCSDLDLVLNVRTLNTKTGANIIATMKNFNQEFKNFLGIKLEYKLQGETSWRGKVFAKDLLSKTELSKLNISTDSILPNTGGSFLSSFTYPLSLKDLPDGIYQIRAKTLCKDGTNVINNITPEFDVIKDLVTPSAMGSASPSNGILTPETEISVTFNENIQSGSLSSDDFEVMGVLNGVTLQHNQGLALDGSEKSEAFTESVLSLQNSSFALEAWVKIDPNCAAFGNIFNIGTGTDKVVLKMKLGALELLINDKVIKSVLTASETDWQYVSLSYNANVQQIQVHLMSSGSGSTIISEKLSSSINPVGRLLVGSGFKGNLQQITVWNESRSITDLSDMNESKSGKEPNLQGYWPLDETYGKLAVDKVRNRNMTINCSWFTYPNGFASSFNGNNQALSIKSSTIPLTNKDNFSLEFWFKGVNQVSKTIFSCGKGIEDVLKPEDMLSVGIDNSGNLVLNVKGSSNPIPNVQILDENWHHFALSVMRGGNSNVYIDGLQRLQIASGKIGGLASDSLSIGARRYFDSKIVDSKVTYILKRDQYFNGMVDEFRIWNSALGAENFRLDMRSKLTGTESGLIAYYPFEETTEDTGGMLQVTPSLKDFSVKNAGNGKYLNYDSSSSSSNTPGIKVPRPKEPVSYSFTANENKIVFNVDAPLKKIENCVLEFAVKKVLDMNGNELTSPIKWTAFVNNNRLNWLTEQVNITKEVLDTKTFTATIVNNSGKYENFVIDALPSWLSVDKSSGKINPLEKIDLTFIIDPATNIGSYESRIILTGNNGIQEMLPMSLKVTGQRPNWAVNPYDFESSMSITGQIKIENVFQEDTEDMLAAFIGNRCVGIAHPVFNKTMNSYILYMDVYGLSSDTNQPIKFSLWDAGTGRIYPDVEVFGTAITFTEDAIIGDVSNVKVFNATNKVEQQLNLKQGWNWVSTNVINNNPTLLNQFKSGIEDTGIQIKSRNEGFINYNAGVWAGSLVALNQTSMYMVKTNQAKTIKLTGAMANQSEAAYKINIASGWNSIGYIPQFVAPVKEALAGLIASEGDQIKGQLGFSTYSGGIWNGSLQYLTPGLGYMYYSKNTVNSSFNYPSQYISASRVIKLNNATSPLRWEANIGKYQQSMTITAVATIDDIEVTNSDLQLGVFIDNECRGSISLQYIENLNRYFAYLMIWGNPEDANKKITFRSFEQYNGRELISNDTSIEYLANDIIGSTANPHVVKINSTSSSINNFNKNQENIYPNPVDGMLFLKYDPKGIEEFEIIDNLGRVQYHSQAMNKNSVDVGYLMPGIYTVRVKHNGTNHMHRLIRK